jgi:hypothetical protein
MTEPVLLESAFNNALSGVSSLEVKSSSFPMTVTPLGCPPAFMARGLLRKTDISAASATFFSSRSGIGIGGDMGHLATPRIVDNRDANQYPSDVSGRYQIATGAFSFPSISSLKTSKSISLGPDSFRNCANFNSASFCLALASAIFLPVSILNRSNAAAVSCASVFWSWKATYVATPTATAENAPRAKNATIKLFQESRLSHHIRLAPFASAALTICGICCAVLFAIFLLSLKNVLTNMCRRR